MSRSLPRLAAPLVGLCAALGLVPPPPAGAVEPPSTTMGPLPFAALAPILRAGDLVLIQEAGGRLAQVTVLTLTHGEADALAALVADPNTHKDMSDSVVSIEIQSQGPTGASFQVEIDTPGFNTLVQQDMTVEPGRTLRVKSSGSLAGDYAWRFTPLPGGQTGVEYTLFADLLNMGAFLKWVTNRSPSINTGANAVTGLVTVTGLDRLSRKYLGGPAEAVSPPPTPDLPALWGDPALTAALDQLTRLGTVAWVGAEETLLLARKTAPPDAVRRSLLAPGGSYPMTLETPFKTYEAVVAQEARGPRALHEAIVDGTSFGFTWTLDFLPLPDGATLVSMRSAVNLTDSLVMRLAMGLDPSVGPALRLATTLSPWERVAP